jgi:hypothetical protein
MAQNIYIDVDAARIVKSPFSTVPQDPSFLFRGDVRDINLHFLRQTGVAGAPYVALDKSAASCKLAIGKVIGSPTDGTWTLDGNSALTPTTTAAALQALLRVSESDNALTVAGNMADGFTVTYGSVGAKSLLTGSVALLLPGCDLTITRRRTGDGSTIDQQFVRVRLTPAVYQPTWTNISSTVAATISTVAAGSSTVSEVQRVTFDKIPATGTWTLTLPSDTRSITAAVVAGVFTTTTNHGFAIGQPSKTGESVSRF